VTVRICLAVILLVLPARGAEPAAATKPSTGVAKPVRVKTEPNKPLAHVYSGFEFPFNIGAFRRVVAYTFDEAGTNLSVGYSDPSLKIIMTVYVYPHLSIPMDKHFKQIKGDIVQVNDKAKLLEDGSFTLRQGKRQYEGMRARYGYIGRLDGVDQDLVSEAYLFRSGRHFVKYRLSYPAADAKAAAIRTEFFLGELKFPEPPKSTTKPSE